MNTTCFGANWSITHSVENTYLVITYSRLSIETLEQGVNFAGLLMFLKQSCTTDFDRRVFNWNTFLNG